MLGPDEHTFTHYYTLNISDYFGEIPLVYDNAKRAETVISRKYSTLAKLTKQSFRQIVSEFSGIVPLLKENTYLC